MTVCMLWFQDQCGASYAFSAMGALEGAWSLAHGELTELSEQNIIDCSGKITLLLLNYCAESILKLLCVKK